MARVLGLSVILLISGIGCGDDDTEPPSKCDSGPTACGGTGGSKPAGQGGAGTTAMDSGIDASTPPDSGPPDPQFDGGEDDAGQ